MSLIKANENPEFWEKQSRLWEAYGNLCKASQEKYKALIAKADSCDTKEARHLQFKTAVDQYCLEVDLNWYSFVEMHKQEEVM